VEELRRSMASSVGGDAGEGEWLKVAELRAMAEAQDPHVKVRARAHDTLLLLSCSVWQIPLLSLS
jgi:hypothetical protein